MTLRLCDTYTRALRDFTPLHPPDVGLLVSDADEVEDKLEKGAPRTGDSAWQIAEFYTRAFKDDIW